LIASHSAVHVIPSPFVSLCVRDLRVYAGALNGSVLHYHDASGFEADAVVEPRGGTYALFEVKIGAWEIDNGAASLLKLARKVDASVMGAPHSVPSSLRAGTPTARRTGSSCYQSPVWPLTLHPPWHAPL